jgi:hypothetical protein
MAVDARKAVERGWKLGIALIVVFFAVRYLDGFGNIRPRMGNHWTAWLTPVKYPPSIAFVLMTTGINLMLLKAMSWLSRRAEAVLRALAVFGRTPLLFYASHLLLYATMGHLVAPRGTTIPNMLPFWLLGLALLFPLCLWYGSLKRRQAAGSILRFF